MDILKRLPGECGTPVCMYASNMENVEKKGFWGKISIVLVQKTYFKIHARWVLSVFSYFSFYRMWFGAEFRFTVCGSEPYFVLPYVVQSRISLCRKWFEP